MEKPVPASIFVLKSSARRVLAGALVLSLVFSQSFALALPSGYVVESGDVSFDTSDPSALVISASDRAIIRFDTFSIDSGETVRFIQPGEASSVLGRVTGGEASDLFGTLRANGEFLLINSAGIRFHSGADIQAGSFIASTLDVQNALYLSGQYQFEKAEGAGPGEILNEGRIATANGGHLVLLGDRVRNAGTLEARLGTVAIGAGEKATLTLGGGAVSLVIDKGLSERLAGAAPVDNSGAISADGGKVILTAKTLNETLDTLVNNEGSVQAETAVVGADGVVEFVSNGAIVNAGDIRATTFRESGYTFRTTGLLAGGNAFFDNLDGAADIGGVVGSNVSDTGDIRVIAPVTLAANNLTFTADSDGNGVGAFDMLVGTSIDGTGARFNLSIFAGAQPSTLRTFTSMGTINLNSSVGGQPSTFAANNAMADQTGFSLGATTIFLLGGQTFDFVAGAGVGGAGTFVMRGSELGFSNVTGLSSNAQYTGDADGLADTFTLKDFGATDYVNLTVNATDTNDVFVLANPLGTSSDLTVTSGVLSLNGNALTVTGAASTGVSGTVRLQGGEVVSLGSYSEAGTWEYVGDGDAIGDSFNILDIDYANLRFDSSDAESFLLTAPQDMSGSITLAATNNGIFSPSGQDITCAGVTVGGGTFFTGTTLDINGNVLVTGGTFNIPGTTTVSGNWSRTGGTTAFGGNVVGFDGVGTQTLDSGGTTFFGVQHTGAGTLRLTGALTVSNTFSNTAGTFDLNGRNWTMTGSMFSNSATVQLQGGETITNLTQDILAGGTWLYVGDADGLSDTFSVREFGVTDYRNLTINPTDAGDVFQLSGVYFSSGNTNVTTGTLSLNGNNISTMGNFQNNATVRAIGSETTALMSHTENGTWEYVGDGDAVADTYTILDFSGIISDYINLRVSATDSMDIFQSAAAKAVGGTLTVTSGTYSANGQTTTVTGAATVSGGIYSAGSATQTFNGNLSVTGPGTFTGSTGTVDVNGNLIVSGTFTAPSGNLFLADDMTITGMFGHNGGNVTFDSAAIATIDAPAGGLAFWDFTCQTAGKTLQFTSADTFSINAPTTWNVDGAAGNLINMTSTAAGQWNVSVNAASNPSASLSFVNVSNSNNTGADITPSNSTNGGGNTGWFGVGGGGGGAGGEPGTPPVGPVDRPNEIDRGNGGPRNDPRNFGDPDPQGDPGPGPGTRPEPTGGNKDPKDAEDLPDTETYVFVDEGAVDVNTKMVYDGEGILVKPDGSVDIRMRAIYVTTVDGIRVFRGKIHTPLKDIKMTESPQSIAATRDGRRVYTIAAKSGLRAIDTGTFGSRDVFGADEGSISVSVSADGSKVYVANGVRDTIKVIDVKSEKILKTFQTGSMPSQVTATSDGAKLFVLNRLDKTVTRLDAETGLQDHAFEAGQSPYGLALSADEKEVFVTDTLGDSVRVFDVASGRETAVIPVGDSPTAIQRDPKGEKIFVSNHGSREMSVIDSKSKKEIGRIAVGDLPSGLAVTPEGDKVYVANQLSGDLSVVHVPDGRVETISVGIGAGQVVISTPEPPKQRPLAV